MKQWSKGTVQLAVIMIGLGFVLMVLGWNGAAGRDTPQEQFPYLLSGTFPGIALVAAGLTLAIVQELRRTTTTLVGKLEQVADSLSAAESGPTAVPDDGSLVIAGRTTYHRPSCALVSGRPDMQAMAPAAAADRGLAPCRVCEPAAEAS